MGWLDYSDISCYYGVTIRNINDMKEFVEGLVNILTDSQKEELVKISSYYSDKNEDFIVDHLYDISNFLNRIAIMTEVNGIECIIGVVGKKYSAAEIFETVGTALNETLEKPINGVFPMINPSEEQMKKLDSIFAPTYLKPKLQYVTNCY